MNTIWLVAICTFWCNFLESTVTTWPVDFNPTLRIDLSVWTHIYNANNINILGTASPCSRGYWLSACVTRPEHPKGARNVVKQARRAKRVAEGHQLEIGAQRAPRLLVIYIFHCHLSWIALWAFLDKASSKNFQPTLTLFGTAVYCIS